MDHSVHSPPSEIEGVRIVIISFWNIAKNGAVNFVKAVERYTIMQVRIVQELQGRFWKNSNWTFSNSPYSFDLAPCDFALFPALKRVLSFFGCRSWVIHSHFFFQNWTDKHTSPGYKNSYTGIINAWTIKVILLENDIYNEK